jgi:tetratricopeptide (TPR) repeat protein
MRPLSLALSLLLLPALASAQNAQTDEARGAFDAGRAAYRAGRFTEALDYFQRAYQLEHQPEILYNIALVHDRLRHDGEALDYYRRYLEADPDTEDRANLEARIHVLEQAIAHREHAPPPPEEHPRRTIVRRVDPGPAPWILAGVGGVVLAGGGVLLILTQLDLETVANGTSWAEIRDAYERVPVLSGTGFAALGLGAALLIAGIAWGIVGSGTETHVVLGPGGATMWGRF